MQLQQIKIALAYESSTNPRGKDFAGPAFDDLVASVREKGVLVPVIARPKPKDGKKFEIVAGNRRFRAAKLAGLAEIPARIEELDDAQAREVQIVENLHREDVHPLEEGEAYRTLIEDGGRSVRDVAVKVGKPEGYVRQRLFLTNLVPKAREVYRKGDLKDAVAYEFARLAAPDQELAFKYFQRSVYWRDNGLADLSIKQIREWAAEHVDTDLSFQPWLRDAAAAKAVGPCTECPPNRPTLFGSLKEGQCVSRKCWAVKMQNYVAFLREKDAKLLAVTLQYADENRQKGIIPSYGFERVNSKKPCKDAQEAIVAFGKEVGRRLLVCVSKNCPKHAGYRSNYTPTAEEEAKRKARRKKEIAAEKAKRAKDTAAMEAAVAKFSWPFTEKHLDAILEQALQRAWHDVHREVAKRRQFLIEEKRAAYGGKYKDYESSIRKAAAALKPKEKVGLVFELLVPAYSPHYDENRASAFKKL